MLVYVDDLLLLGQLPSIQSLLAAIQTKWETSKPEYITQEGGVRFLGAELRREADGSWIATQANYTADLLKRNLGGEMEEWKLRKVPMVKEIEVEEEEEEKKELKQIRLAQRIVGELVWLSTRCRPDIMFVVSKMAGLITRRPSKVVQLAEQVWGYLAATLNEGLLFKNSEDDKEMNVYSDSSFGVQPHGCVLVQWGSSPILWKSSRQVVVTTSTAESELVEVLDAAISGEAIRVVVEEILEERVRALNFTDSSAALAIIAEESASWRTRHLRVRAHSLRTRVLQGDWAIRHLPGSEMPADLGTKVLTAQRFQMLKELLGMFIPPILETGEHAVKKNWKPTENIQKALKAIILAAQIMSVKGGEDDSNEMSERQPSGNMLEWMMMLMLMLGFALGVSVTMAYISWNHGPPGALPMTTMGAPHPDGSPTSDESQEELDPIYLAVPPAAFRNRRVRKSDAPRGAGDGGSRGSGETGRTSEETTRPVGVTSNFTSFLLTPTGRRYHRDRECVGLRNAHAVFQAVLCENCEPRQHGPPRRLWSLGPGYLLHRDPNHVVHPETVQNMKPYDPCRICI